DRSPHRALQRGAGAPRLRPRRAPRLVRAGLRAAPAGSALVSADLLDLSIAELSRLLRDGKASPVEVTHATLDRIAKVDPRLNSFITVTPEAALAAARRAEAEIT